MFGVVFIQWGEIMDNFDENAGLVELFLNIHIIAW